MQLVTNGDFSNGLNNWSVVGGSYASVNNGILNSNNTVNGSWFGQYIAQDVSFVNGKTYKITFKAKNISGNLNLRLTQGANVIVNYNLTSEFVSYTYYYTSNADNGSLRMFCNDAVGQFEIDSVSVRKVGQDWSLGTGWSIGEDKLNFTNVNGSSNQSGVFVIGKTYKITCDYVFTSGTRLILPYDGSNFNSDIVINTPSSAIGYTYYYTPLGGNALFTYSDGNGNGSITNISVKEVGQNWDILDSVTSFSFNNGIANIQGTANYANNGIKQASISAVIGKTYKISATLRSNDGGLYRFRILDGSYFDLGSGNSAEFETITSYHTATSTAFTIFATSWYTNGTANFDISNISIIEISTDTNLPRINYEGFSYQDALGSEEIVNGGFDSDTAWIKGTTWSIGGGFASATEDDGSYLYQANVCEIGKKYKFTFDVTESSGVPHCVSLFNVWFDTSALAVGSYSIIHTAVNTSGIRFRCKTGGTGSFAIDNVSVKEYLGQEVVPDSGCGSWLWESQSTNIITQSELFSDASWLKESSATLGLNTYLSPSGENNASELNLPSTLSRITYVFNSTGVYTFSVYLKSDTDGTISLRSATGNPAVTKQVNLTDKWQRFDISVTDGNYWQVIKTASDTLTSVYLWGAQLEQQSYVTSYIPTEGTQKTRNQDVCTNGGSLASINSTEGVIYWEGAKLQEASGTQVIGLSDGSGVNRIGFQTSATANQIRFVVDAGGNQASKFFVLDDITDFNKLALKWKQDDFSFWVNGIKIGTDTSGNVPALNALNTLDFYYGTGNGTGIYNFTAKTKALAVWKEALSDEELTELTTI